MRFFFEFFNLSFAPLLLTHAGACADTHTERERDADTQPRSHADTQTRRDTETQTHERHKRRHRNADTTAQVCQKKLSLKEKETYYRGRRDLL